jgi:hypothetical protein
MRNCWGCPTSRAFREVGRDSADTDGLHLYHNRTVRGVTAQMPLPLLASSHVE